MKSQRITKSSGIMNVKSNLVLIHLLNVKIFTRSFWWGPVDKSDNYQSQGDFSALAHGCLDIVSWQSILVVGKTFASKPKKKKKELTLIVALEEKPGDYKSHLET